MNETQKTDSNNSRPTVPATPDAATRFYKENGYLVARGLFSPEEIAEIKKDTTNERIYAAAVLEHAGLGQPRHQ